MKILIAEKLSPHRFKTPEGYLICTDAILARTGKQTYRRSEVFGDSCRDAESEVEVDRSEKEVFDPRTLASFENKPVTVEHPAIDVNSENYKDYAVGFTRDIHRGEVNGEPVILGTLVITDAQTIEEIENGEHTDLSCGYDCDIVDETNPCQRNIRGNHVALCEQGRAGIARIVDSKCKDFEQSYNYKGFRIITVQRLNGSETFVESRSGKRYKVLSLDHAERLIDSGWTKLFDSVKDGFKNGDHVEYDGMKATIVRKLTETEKQQRAYAANPNAGDYYEIEVQATKHLKGWKTIVWEKRLKKIADSTKDARMKVANLTNGYAIVPTSRWRKFGLNSEVERFTTNLDEARYIRSSLERNDGISFVIVDVTQRRTTDSMKDLDTTVTFKGFNYMLETYKHMPSQIKAIIDKIKAADDLFDHEKDVLLKKAHKYLGDSVNDAEQIFRVLAAVPGDYDDEPGFDIIFNVKANSENEAIAKAKKYAEKTPAYRFAWDFRIAKPNQHTRVERNVDSVKDADMIWTVVAEFEEEGGIEGSKNFNVGLTYLVEANSEQEAIDKVKKIKPNAIRYKATKSAKTFSETELKFMKNRGRYVDASHTFEVCYFDNGPVCIMINANSTEDALRKFRQEYGWHTIKYIHQKDSVKDQHPVFTEGFRELDPSEVKEILTKRKNGKSYPELVDEYKDIRSSTLLALIENFDKGYIKLSDSVKDSMHTYEIKIGDCIHFVRASSMLDAVKIVKNRK